MNNFKDIERGLDYVLDEIKYQIGEAKVRNFAQARALLQKGLG